MPVFKFDVSGLPEKRFNKGDALLKEGEYAGRVYVLKDGTLSVQAGGVELARLTEPRTIVGEVSVLLERRHSATVQAECFTVVYIIEDLVGYAKANPEVALYLAQLLAQRMVNMNQMFTELKDAVSKPKAAVAKELTTEELEAEAEKSPLGVLLGRIGRRFRSQSV